MLPGFVLVPEEPTSKQLKAAMKEMSPGNREGKPWVSVKEKHRLRYTAMLQVRPAIPPPSLAVRLRLCWSILRWNLKNPAD